MLQAPGEALFSAQWAHVVFIHYKVEAATLQRSVPFPLELHKNQAFVSLVAFTLRNMRPRHGGRIGAQLFRPLAAQKFLNVRTYVRVGGESGIFFLNEWLSNALCVPLGGPLLGLPYHYARISYDHENPAGEVIGSVKTNLGSLSYHGNLENSRLGVCARHSRAEFLMERYTAFTRRWFGPRRFRVGHEPWLHAPLQVELTDTTLLERTSNWWPTAQFASASYSPGVSVWMGRPLRAH